MIREVMDSMPLWGVLFTTVASVLMAIEVGYRTGRWRTQNREFDSEALLSAMTGAHLALLAFIMAFSFSQAAGHYNKRKALILDEANAIGTAHLRAELVNSVESEAIAHLLAEYAGVRAGIASLDPGGAHAMISRSTDLHEAISEQLKQHTSNAEPTELDALLVHSVNEIIDLHERRASAGLRTRIPPTLWGVLFMLLILAMAGIGYFSGVKGARNPIASTGLALSFSLVMSLIADLDRPSRGLVKADHTVMIELQQRLNR